MDFTIISIALLVSLIGNVVQIVFYLTKVCLDYRKYKDNVEEHKKRESYNDLKEQNEDGIWI
jgi:hypothetical protein